MTAPKVLDHITAIQHLHEQGFAPTEIRDALMRQNYFSGKSKKQVMSFVQQRIHELRKFLPLFDATDVPGIDFKSFGVESAATVAVEVKLPCSSEKVSKVDKLMELACRKKAGQS